MPADEVYLRGERIRALRESKNIEPGVLAYKAKISTAQVYRLEGDERPNTSAVIVGKVAHTLDTTVEYLIGLTDDPAPLSPSKLELDPVHVIRLQELAHRVACLSPETQQLVIEAAMMTVEAAEVAQQKAPLEEGGPHPNR